MGKTYIVTGADGYVGFSVTTELLKRGCEVRAIVKHGEPHEHLDERGVEVFHADICDKDSMREAFDVKGELIVVHAAGIVSVREEYTEALRRVNVDGTRNVAELCVEHGARLIYVGSVDAMKPVPGAPMTEPERFYPDEVYTGYAKSKAEAGNIVLDCAGSIDAAVVLPTAVFGPYDYHCGMFSTMISIFIKKLNAFSIHGGYDLVDTRDVAYAIAEACERGRSGECYILGNRKTGFTEIINNARRLRGLGPVRLTIPDFLAKAAGHVGGLIATMRKKQPVFTAYTIECVTSDVTYSHGKAARELGFAPRPLEESLKDMLSFMKNLGYIK